MMLLTMFLVFFYFGCFCLSGGGSLLQFYIDDLVNGRGWMTLDELGNLIAISQVTPGPIGVNLATFIGYQHGGILGGLLCTLGLLMPSFFMMSLAVHYYSKFQNSKVVNGLMYGIKPATLTLIAASLSACLGLSIFTAEIPYVPLLHWLSDRGTALPAFSVRWEYLPVFAGAFYALYRKKLSIMAVILLSGLAGVLLAGLRMLL